MGMCVYVTTRAPRRFEFFFLPSVIGCASASGQQAAAAEWLAVLPPSCLDRSTLVHKNRSIRVMGRWLRSWDASRFRREAHQHTSTHKAHKAKVLARLQIGIGDRAAVAARPVRPAKQAHRSISIHSTKSVRRSSHCHVAGVDLKLDDQSNKKTKGATTLRWPHTRLGFDFVRRLCSFVPIFSCVQGSSGTLIGTCLGVVCVLMSQPPHTWLFALLTPNNTNPKQTIHRFGSAVRFQLAAQPTSVFVFFLHPIYVHQAPNRGTQTARPCSGQPWRSTATTTRRPSRTYHTQIESTAIKSARTALIRNRP